jgi:hypothetical protein
VNDSLETATVYDKEGNIRNHAVVKLRSTKRGIGGMFMDNDGNFIVHAAAPGEMEADAVYFARNGEERWRWPAGGATALQLSPSGKYALLAAAYLKTFTAFWTSDTSQHLPIPFAGDSGKGNLRYAADFTSDGAVVFITSDRTIYRYNPESGIIEATTRVQTPDGKPMVPTSNEWMGSHFSNPARTLFATLIFDASDNGPDRVTWILVYDGAAKVRMQRREPKARDMAFVEDKLFVTKFDETRRKWQRIMFRDFSSEPEIIDRESKDDVGVALHADSSYYFYYSGEKGACKYNPKTRQFSKRMSQFPLFKPNRTKTNKVWIPVAEK